MPGPSEEETPTHLRPGDDREEGLVSVTVTEHALGVVVQARGSGRVAEANAAHDSSSINVAIVNAVADLRRVSRPRRTAIDVRKIEDSPIVTVVLQMSSGEELAGASILTTGMRFSVAVAAWRALDEMSRPASAG